MSRNGPWRHKMADKRFYATLDRMEWNPCQ